MISIIVPVYNIEKYIKASVTTMLNQTYKDIEIILIDDGSTDKSGYICDEMSKKDDRIKVIHQENGGAAAARNAGLNKMTGEYVTFIDGDDLVAPDYIQRLYDDIKKAGSDITICGYDTVGEDFYLYKTVDGRRKDSENTDDSTEILTEESTKKSTEESTEELTEESKQSSSIMIYNREEGIIKLLYQEDCDSQMWVKLYKSELFKDIRFPVGNIYEDFAIIYKVFSKAKRVSYGSHKGYYYLERNTGTTLKKFSPKKMDIVDTAEANEIYLNEFFEKSGYDTGLLKKALASKNIRVNFHIYMQIPRDAENKEYRKRAENNIKKYRKIVLLDKRARKGTKAAILITYLGFGVFYNCKNLKKIGKK